MTAPLSVTGLRVVSLASGAALVDGVAVALDPAELVGVVGESGSGKTTLGLACLGFAKSGTRIAAGELYLGGRDSVLRSPVDLVARRRRHVGYVPQSAGFALDPALRIGTQLRERLAGSGAEVTNERLLDALDEVALPRDGAFLRRYPHELSGGQQQRVLIASAFIVGPKVVILDEPTTGLDVTTQARILAMVRRICVEHGTAGIFISHDLGAVAELCSRALVMYAGRVVETGPINGLLGSPRHPYTRGLLQGVPSVRAEHPIVGMPGQAPAPEDRGHGCTFVGRCPHMRAECHEREPELVTEHGRSVRCFFPQNGQLARAGEPPGAMTSVTSRPLRLEVVGLRAHYHTTEVLHGLDVVFEPGACTAVVGESGSGKSTLCQTLVGLHSDYSGEVLLDGERLRQPAGRRQAKQRRAVQYIFQNPYDQLNPRRTVAALIQQPLQVFGERVPRGFVLERLEQVSLGPETADRYPHELSGGERQRVALARALAVGPRILICDEVTSALDVSVQASVVALIRRLQREMSLTIVFVTHNITLVRHIAQAVIVLKDGYVVEGGPTRDVLDQPEAPYTRSLLEHTPDLWQMNETWRNGVAETNPSSTPRGTPVVNEGGT